MKLTCRSMEWSALHERSVSASTEHELQRLNYRRHTTLVAKLDFDQPGLPPNPDSRALAFSALVRPG